MRAVLLNKKLAFLQGFSKKLFIDSTLSLTLFILVNLIIFSEYGMGKRASTEGDVYSFGVLLLEIVTGRRPTDVLFQDGSSLYEWMKRHYPDRLEPIVEQAIVRYKMPPFNYNKVIWRDVFLELIELGLLCTQYSPSTRPTMLDVASEMGRLKQYLSNPSSYLMQEATLKGGALV